jgi:hypothetical protein
MFVGGAVIGCEANFDADHDHDGEYYKKTTTVREPDGDRRVKTEIRRDD